MSMTEHYSEVDRFNALTAPDPNSGCWFWMGADNGDGYGGFRRSKQSGGKWERAHRISYKLFIGKIPKDKELDHLCRVRCCVNPAHLEPVTSQENSRRGLTGINHSSKTHCPKGHPYSGINLYINTYGKRECRKCIKDRRHYRLTRS